MQTLQKILRRITRLTAVLVILAIPVTLLLAFKAQQRFDDIWQKIGISKIKGEEHISASFMNGYFSYYGAEKAKHLLSGDRAAVAKDLMAYTKQQIMSPAFKKQYDEMRTDAKPEAPDGKVKTKEEVRKEKIAEIEKSLKESEKIIKENPSMAEIMKGSIELYKNYLKDYQNPASLMIETFYQGELYEHQAQLKSYQERLAKWEKEYPADYKLKVKERLLEFVNLAKTVDFSAELKDVRGKKKFVNPAYEGKGDNWKQIFRAGKEVIVPAIAFAEQWIKELN